MQKLLNSIQQFKNVKMPKKVKIVEMGPRDGLQNEKTIVSTDDKITFINKLSNTGLQAIETTSFVSKKWVPQMGDASEVYTQINKNLGVAYPVLVPNIQGLNTAMKAGVKEIAVFGAASETFSLKNINCSIVRKLHINKKESLLRFEQVTRIAKENQIKIRGYVSCVMGCPYEGDVPVEKVREVVNELFNLGCYEVSLGDTIGAGTPEKTQALFSGLKDFKNLAAHFHDTYDRAIDNILVALSNGIDVIDSSVAGLGGCPYAGRAAGNVCTENVLFVFDGLNIEHGIDVKQLKQTGEWISALLKRENQSKY